MTRKICVVTGTRAEYGLLRWVMQGIKDAPDVSLQVIATGTHLSAKFGSTFREIEKDGFAIDRKVEMMLSSDSPVGIAKSMGIGLIGFADALNELRPDLMVVLGDRFEILSAVSAALVARIPVAHLHGGETTEGAFDDAIRHALTKMSHLHFVAAEEYRRRVIQLGEAPDRVFVVGGLGIDGIKRLKLLNRPELESRLDFHLGNKSLLVTFHPATLESDSPERQTKELLLALADLRDTRLIFTMPNADPGSQSIRRLIEDFVSRHDNARVFTSLGQLVYLSCVSHVDGVVGNSSSGIIETPSFHKGTVNIGDRQEGRLKAKTVIDCPPQRKAIAAAIERLYSPAFQAALASATNPYGEGHASERIVAAIAKQPLGELVKKKFFDLAPLSGDR